MAGPRLAFEATHTHPMLTNLMELQPRLNAVAFAMLHEPDNRKKTHGKLPGNPCPCVPRPTSVVVSTLEISSSVPTGTFTLQPPPPPCANPPPPCPLFLGAVSSPAGLATGHPGTLRPVKSCREGSMDRGTRSVDPTQPTPLSCPRSACTSGLQVWTTCGTFETSSPFKTGAGQPPTKPRGCSSS